MSWLPRVTPTLVTPLTSVMHCAYVHAKIQMCSAQIVATVLKTEVFCVLTPKNLALPPYLLTHLLSSSA